MPIAASLFRRPPAIASLAALVMCLSLAPALAAPRMKLSMADAKQIALAKEAGKIKTGELEHEKGRWIYSFDIVTGKQIHEVNVDANSGEVVEDTVENAAAEAREKAEDQKPK